MPTAPQTNQPVNFGALNLKTAPAPTTPSTPSAPVQMTRAEYQAKYGAAPVAPATQSAPVQMTHAQYMAKYGAQTPPASEKSIFQQILDGGSAVADSLGFGGAVNTIGDELAPAALALDPSTSLKQKVDASQNLHQVNPLEAAGAGAEIGLSTSLPELGAEKTAATVATRAAAKEAAGVIDAVSPKLTAKATAGALATQGATKSGILGTIKLNPAPSTLKIADAVSKFVPTFDSAKPLVENINATKDAVSGLATDLKQKVIAAGQDRIFSFKELGSQLKAVEKPTLLVGDLEKAYGNVINKAMEIARSNGGHVSDLLDTRKEFDNFVSREFPNLYSSDTLTPMRSAIKGIRNAITDFTAEHLPDDVNLRDSLTNQSRLLDAIDNMSEKAAAGAQKEIGTNAIQRAALRHPTIKKALVGGAAALGVDKAVKDTTGFGL